MYVRRFNTKMNEIKRYVFCRNKYATESELLLFV